MGAILICTKEAIMSEQFDLVIMRAGPAAIPQPCAPPNSA